MLRTLFGGRPEHVLAMSKLGTSSPAMKVRCPRCGADPEKTCKPRARERYVWVYGIHESRHRAWRASLTEEQQESLDSLGSRLHTREDMEPCE